MTAPPVEAAILTVFEVARLLRISKSLAYRLCTDGTILSARIASVGSRRGRVVVRRKDVDAFLDRLFAETLPSSKRAARIDVDAVVARVRRRHRRA